MPIKHKTTVQDVDYGELKQELLKANQVVEWGDDMVDDPIKRMEETFGKVVTIIKVEGLR